MSDVQEIRFAWLCLIHILIRLWFTRTDCCSWFASPVSQMDTRPTGQWDKICTSGLRKVSLRNWLLSLKRWLMFCCLYVWSGPQCVFSEMWQMNPWDSAREPSRWQWFLFFFCALEGRYSSTETLVSSRGGNFIKCTKIDFFGQSAQRILNEKIRGEDTILWVLRQISTE